MSFIGESRKSYTSPWKIYLCLTKDDCKLIYKTVCKVEARKKTRYEKYKDIQDGGEATERQQTLLFKAQDEWDAVKGFKSDIEEFLKIKR